MTMFDRFINLGLGALSLTKEKAEIFINEMVERGEINREDAKQTVENVMTKGEELRDAIRNMVKEEMDSIKNKSDSVSKAEYDELLERVKELESKLNQQNPVE